MLDTAWRQLRHGWAVASGRRIRVRDVEALVRHVRATRAEFGRLDRDRMLEVLGTAPDPQLRRVADARRWRAVVRAAYTQTRYYRRLLDRLGLRPEELTLERAAELPLTPKSAVRGLPEAFVSSRSEPVLQANTTGSTGTPTSCWFSAYELDLSAAYGALHLMLHAGVGPEDVVALGNSSRAAMPVHNMLRSVRLVGAVATLIGIVDPAQTLARLATPVHLPGKKPRVSVLLATPSHLAELVQAAQALGYRATDFGLEQIVCGGEVLSAALRRRAEDTFGARVWETYAMTETVPVAGQGCREGHLHFTPELGLLEVLDPQTHRPVPPGAVGTLVVTPYLPYRETTLVLRYATGDLVRTMPEPPRCELAGLPATSALLGRAAADGDGRSGPALYQRDILDLLEADPALPLPVRYQVEAATDGYDLHVHGPEDDHSVVARLERRAADLLLPVRKIVLHDRVQDLGNPQFVRSLLRETILTRDEEAGTWTLR